MPDKSEIERRLQILEKNCGYYFSRVIGRPLCPPEHVYFSLTNRCNLSCKMCGISGNPSQENEELKTEECKKIIDQIAGLKIEHLIFSGGEPLLRSDIFDLIAYAVGRRIKMVDIITNGLLIDAGTAKMLSCSGLNHITVSIDGLETTDDFIRGKGSFRGAVEGINFINEYKCGRLPTIGINFTVMDCNFDQIIPMIDLAKEKKCNIIVLQPLLSDNTKMQERSKNALWVSEKNISQLRNVMKEVGELKNNLCGLSVHVNKKILEMIPDYFAGLPLDENLKCYDGIVRIVISYNGDLWTCRGTYGNLKKKSLKECWFSSRARKLRQEVKQCRNHCLQSCIHLAELSDIYSEAEKVKNLISHYAQDKAFSGRLTALFKKYSSLLGKEKQSLYIKNIFSQKEKDGLIALGAEISQMASLRKI